MIYLIIGIILLYVAWLVNKANTKKNMINYAQTLILIYVAIAIGYQDVYFHFIVRPNIDDFYNTGYGTIYRRQVSVFDNVTNTTNTTTQTYTFYDVNDTRVGEYFAFQKSEGDIMGILTTVMPLMILFSIMYILYHTYRNTLKGITNDKQ